MVAVAYRAFALELEGQGGGFGSGRHCAEELRCIGVDAGKVGGGVDVKPTFNGRVHTMYAATFCTKPRPVVGKVSLHVETAVRGLLMRTRMRRRREEEIDAARSFFYDQFADSIPELVGLARTVTQHPPALRRQPQRSARVPRFKQARVFYVADG
jgi:hypothetical protein